MDDLMALRESLRSQRPVPWDQLPDFALYMDQVLSYMDRQVIRFDKDDGLTAAMVNNYTKSGLVPRAAGKRYGREHLAYPPGNFLLKHGMGTRDLGLLVNGEVQGGAHRRPGLRRLLRQPGRGFDPDRPGDGAVHGRGGPGGRRHPLRPYQLRRRRRQQPVRGAAAAAERIAGAREQASQKRQKRQGRES